MIQFVDASIKNIYLFVVALDEGKRSTKKESFLICPAYFYGEDLDAAMGKV